MSRSTIVGAIEIGTSKVVVLVAEMSGGRSMNIIGRGQSTNAGIKKGEIVDLRSVSDCTHAAILAAERSAGAKIEHVYLSLSGGHLGGFRHPGATSISSSGNLVTQMDMKRAVENAKSKVLDAGQVYIHHIQNGFILDVRNPTEVAIDRVPGAVNIPLPQLRARLSELPADREIHVHCRSGQRSYYATRILLQNGFRARNISGGMLTRSHSPELDQGS